MKIYSDGLYYLKKFFNNKDCLLVLINYFVWSFEVVVLM